MKNPNNKKKVNLRAYAKINLGLIIKAKREDSYHEIDTIYVPIRLYDKITLEKFSDNIKIECNNSSIPTDNNNLAYIAFQKLKEKYPSKIKEEIKIKIKKNVPVGAGLGGGSSNAAAVLLGIRKLWNINISNKLLKNIASEIGSDVPFFIDCEPSLGRGKGEILEKIDFNLKKWILLIYPNINISSSWAYEHFNFVLTNRIKNINLAKIIKKNIFKFRYSIINDLEIPVFKKYPQLMNIKEDLYKMGAEFALMSGSGSCIYGLFKNKYKALEVSNRFKKFGNIYLTRQILKPKIISN